MSLWKKKAPLPDPPQQVKTQPQGTPAPAPASAPPGRVAPRVRLKPLHAVSFERIEPPAAEPFTLLNLSTTGMGLRTAPGQAWPQRGATVKGKLRIGPHLLEITAELVHQSAGVIGCHFTGSTTAVDTAVKEHFRVELAGLLLRPVNPAILKRTEEGQPHWFTGRNNCELYLMELNGKVVRWEASVFGNRLGWREGRSLETVRTTENEATGKIQYKGSDLETPGVAPPTELVRGAQTLLETVEALPEKLREQALASIAGTRTR